MEGRVKKNLPHEGHGVFYTARSPQVLHTYLGAFAFAFGVAFGVAFAVAFFPVLHP
jgi:hypothetical protein